MMMATSGVGANEVQVFDCFSTLVQRSEGAAIIFCEERGYVSALEAAKCSGSSALNEKLWRRLSHTKSALKSHVRGGVHPTIRRHLWRSRLEINDEDVVLYSRALGQPDDATKQTTVPPQFPECPGLPSFSTRPQFTTSYARVLNCVAQSCPSITHAPFLPILTHFLLHFLEEWEVYVALRNLIHRPAWVTTSRTEARACVLTLTKLMETHVQGIDLESLRPVGMGRKLFFSELFESWYSWAFMNMPFWFAVRMVDMYLVEGPKVLFRIALAAINICANSDYACSASAQTSPTELVPQFLSQISTAERHTWIVSAIGIRHFPWSTVYRLWLSNCVPVPERQPNKIAGEKTKKRVVQMPEGGEIMTATSQWQTLWDWLPEWVLSDVPRCIFQASKDGYNLRTLFGRCEDLDPLLIIIKSKENAVFGAFIVGDLHERHSNQFFGSGESFLFTVEPVAAHFTWTAESDLILRANDEELIVGSGGGAFGLWIDGELDRGSSSTCAAFGNPPLTGSSAVDFKCAAIEVYYCE